MNRKLVLGVAIAAAFAVVGGIAYAASSGSGTIAACAKEGSGLLRLDTGAGCLPNEQSIQWNQAGPQGPPGNTDSTVRNATGFILDGATTTSPVVSSAGKLGTLSFTCSDVTYTTNGADTNPFADRVMFYSPNVPDSPLFVTVNQNGAGDHLTVPWPSGSQSRSFQMLIEGEVGDQTQVTLTTINGFVEGFPQFSGCSYFAYVQTSDVRSPQTFTP